MRTPEGEVVEPQTPVSTSETVDTLLQRLERRVRLRRLFHNSRALFTAGRWTAIRNDVSRAPAQANAAPGCAIYALCQVPRYR